MAKLRKRGNSWEIDYCVNGKRFRRLLGSNKRTAELYLKDVEVKIARKELGFEVKDGAYAKLVNQYQAYCKTNLAPATYARYQSILDNFNRFLNSEYPHLSKISHFRFKHFEDFKSFRKQEGAVNRTVNAEVIVVRMMFRLGIQWGYSAKNPSDGITKLNVPTKLSPRFLSEEECKALLDCSDDWLRPIFFTFLNTGMRKSELENLEWPEVDFGRRKIKIVVKDNWVPKTNEREIPINDGLLKLLEEQKLKVNGSSYVFPDEDGGKIYKNRLLRRLKALATQLKFGDDVNVHTLRHTFASHLVMNGVDLATIKRLLGHSDIETTMIYSHLTDKHVDSAVTKLDFLLV
jgi:site-specific recombinase XerD